MVKQIHGGDVYRNPGVLDFSSNMNPLGTPKRVVEAGKRSMELLFQYPDVQQMELLQDLAVYEGIPKEYLICGNGAAELIFLFAQALKPAHALLAAPGFAEYALALSSVGCDISYYYLKEEDGFRLTEDILEAIVPGLEVLILCSPNNPTGLVIPVDLMHRIMEKCRETGTYLMVDECFQDFCEDTVSYSLKSELHAWPHVFLLKAFTKRYALAGIRLGYGISADADLLEKMHRMVQPWNVSLPAQMVGVAALREEEYVREARALVAAERRYLKESLQALGFKVFDSEANYVFFKGPEGLVEKALKKKVLIRSCANYPGLGEEYYRVAVRTHEENQTLLEALA
ncbi:MAG: pyridoxal phosphate-dependent class II aminotransferase [Eubacteriales bacterium]|nr:pyridoxal phosphate-dependent class II aminotransferase [Eubacteriales bacterium]